MPPRSRRPAADRRTLPRPRHPVPSDLIFRAFRASAAHVNGFRAALGVFLVSGILVAVVFTTLFAYVASHVRAGRTQAFDDNVLRWLSTHRTATVGDVMLEITFLGTGLVVMTMVAITGMFLWLTRHRYSALLLVFATAGDLVLNSILKIGFDRPRPQVFEWGAHVVSSSFPSGHAMSATVVYTTVAYLAARLQRRRLTRGITMLLAFVLIALICVSRLYLGVHYPSDVLGGVLIGFAWAGFCMASLEAVQLLGRTKDVDVRVSGEHLPLMEEEVRARS